MALAACRECGHEVSTEATACPHCGVGAPASSVAEPAAAPETATGRPFNPRDPWSWVIVLVIFVGLPLAYVGYRHFQGGVTADGPSVEQQIVDRYGHMPGTNVTVTAQCPATFKLRKGKIVDCTVTRPDSGQSTKVFLSGVDNSGHYQMQIEDPFIMVNR